MFLYFLVWQPFEEELIIFYESFTSLITVKTVLDYEAL